MLNKKVIRKLSKKIPFGFIDFNIPFLYKHENYDMNIDELMNLEIKFPGD